MPVNDTWERRQQTIQASRDRIASGGCAIPLILAAGAVATAVYGIVRGIG